MTLLFTSPIYDLLGLSDNVLDFGLQEEQPVLSVHQPPQVMRPRTSRWRRNAGHRRHVASLITNLVHIGISLVVRHPASLTLALAQEYPPVGRGFPSWVFRFPPHPSRFAAPSSRTSPAVIESSGLPVAPEDDSPDPREPISSIGNHFSDETVRHTHYGEYDRPEGSDHRANQSPDVTRASCRRSLLILRSVHFFLSRCPRTSASTFWDYPHTIPLPSQLRQVSGVQSLVDHIPLV